MKLLPLSVTFVVLSTFSVVQADTIRDYYDEPGINPFKDTGDQGFYENVDTFSGALQIGLTDIHLPGNGGFDIDIKRSYATPYVTNDERSPYGFGWSMHFGRIVTSTSHSDKVCSQSLWATSVVDNPSIELPDGSRKLLVLADYHAPSLITKDWWSAECDGNTVIVKSPDGTTYHMNHHSTYGNVKSIYATYIEDRNGNFMNVVYQTNPAGFAYIDSLSTSDGRSVEFTYTDESNGDIRLTEVEANGQIWTYQYTFPSGVVNPPPHVRPDSDFWEFEYNPILPFGDAGSLAMDTLTTPMGGTIEYTYDYVYFDSSPSPSSTTVVDTRTTGGTDVTAGTWTYTYTPGFQSGTGYDETQVTRPDGSFRVDYHVGYSSVGSGNVWRTGLKEFEEKYDSGAALQEQINFVYQPLVISNENFWHGRDTGRIDTQTNIPVLEEVYHYREGRSVSTTYSNYTGYGQPQTMTETPTVTSHADRVTTYTYSNDATNWLLGLVTEEVVSLPTAAPVSSWTIERTFDTVGNLLSDDRYGVETTYTYTAEGDINTITDDNNNTTTLSNYHRGIAQQENQPESITIYRTVNSTGTLDSVTNGRGHTTSFTWDNLNRLTEIDYPINADVTISYTNNERELNRGGYQEVVTWDGFGRELDLTRSDTAAMESVTITRLRDALGQVVFESYPNSANGVTSTYDEFNRKLSSTHTNGDQVLYDYPSVSEIIITDENGELTEKSYAHHGALEDERAWLMDTISPEGVATLYDRDGLGQPRQVFQGEIQQDGQILGFGRTYTRNASNFLTGETHPETGTTSYTHDAVGNVLTKTLGGVTETFIYDDRYRLVTKSYSDSTPAVSYSYDDSDNLLTSNNTLSSRAFTYDQNGNLTDETLTVGTQVYDLAYGVNSLDFVSSLTYPSGRVVNRAPDALGRQSTATPYVTAIQYHPNGLPQSITLDNGVTTAIGVDARQRVDTIEVGDGITDIVDLTYGYDNSLNVLSVTDGVGSLHDRTLTYDGLNRLTSATGPWGSELVTYDGTNNIDTRDRNGTVQDYYYNNMQLSYRVFPSYFLTVTHDSRGNVTDDGLNQFTYNGDDKLVTATVSGSTINYTYDGEGTRVSRSDTNGDRHYFYNARGLLIGDYDPTGGFDEYVYINRKLAARINDDTTIVGGP